MGTDWLKVAFKLSVVLWIGGVALSMVMKSSQPFDAMNVRSVADIFFVLAAVLGLILAARAVRRKRVTTQQGAPRPSAPHVTFAGSDMAALTKSAAIVATNAVTDQFEQLARRNGGERPSGSSMRFATDDFVVGYGVGVATRHVQINGRAPHEIPMELLISELQRRLSLLLPNLDAESSYRGGSIRLASGICLGLTERGEKQNGMVRMLESMSPLELAPGVMMRQFAFERGADPQQAYMVEAACEEMRARYANG